MEDRHARIKERERGLLAKQVLDNPVWVECWQRYVGNLEAHILNPATPEETVLEARRMHIVAARVRRDLENVMQTGQMADMQLEQMEKRDHGTGR